MARAIRTVADEELYDKWFGDIYTYQAGRTFFRKMSKVFRLSENREVLPQNEIDLRELNASWSIFQSRYPKDGSNDGAIFSNGKPKKKSPSKTKPQEPPVYDYWREAARAAMAKAAAEAEESRRKAAEERERINELYRIRDEKIREIRSHRTAEDTLRLHAAAVSFILSALEVIPDVVGAYVPTWECVMAVGRYVYDNKDFIKEVYGKGREPFHWNQDHKAWEYKIVESDLDWEDPLCTAVRMGEMA